MTNMLVRIVRLAASRWGVTVGRAVSLLAPIGGLAFVEDNYDLFHMEGDEAILDDVEEYLASRGVDPYAMP